MRRVVIWALGLAFSLALGGCASFSSFSIPAFDTPKPMPVELKIDSRPSGAMATTSDGASCQTPCALQMVPKPGVSVTFALDRHLPQTIALQVSQRPGPPDFLGNTAMIPDLDPNPVFAELQPAAPPRKARKPAPKRRKPVAAAPAEAAPAAAPPAQNSPFPPPQR